MVRHVLRTPVALAAQREMQRIDTPGGDLELLGTVEGHDSEVAAQHRPGRAAMIKAGGEMKPVGGWDTGST